jgi:hypothetical protein
MEIATEAQLNSSQVVEGAKMNVRVAGCHGLMKIIRRGILVIIAGAAGAGNVRISVGPGKSHFQC